MAKHKDKRSHIALFVAAIYALFGFFWILFSDKLLTLLVRDTELINQIQIFKGWLYVLISAAIIYLLIAKYDHSVQKNQNKYQRLIDNIVDPYFLINSKGEIVDANNEAILSLGYSRKELLGMSLDQIDPDLNLEQWIKRIDQIDLDQHLKLETKHKRKDGTIFPVEVVGCIFEEDSQKFCLSVVRDISHRIKTLELMVQNEKMSSLGGMAAGIAHEINNPLSAILGACQNIINRCFTDTPKNLHTAQDCNLDLEAMREYIRKREILRMISSISDAGERASRIISSMLNFSRGGSQAINTCHIQNTLDESLELVSSDFSFSSNNQLKRTKIIKDYPTNPVQLCCNRSEIQQVLMNLVKNASEAMAEKKYTQGESPELNLRIKESADKVIMEVEDNGPGIPKKILKKIFEPFYTTKDVGMGTGLGLSISYFIITEQHRGEMKVSSTPEYGTKFTIILPKSSCNYKDIK